MASLQKYAEYYAGKGLAVFPCKARGKEPLTAHGCKDATTDPAKIRSWWTKWPDANIGMATGEPSGIVVLDIDKHEDADGAESLRDWESEFEALPATKTVLTGSGGVHYWFRTTKDVRNRAGVLPGIDVRGTGGYVVIPPSVHPNGTPYEWDAATEELPVADLPEELWSLIRGERSEYGPAFELPAVVGQGQRNEQIFKLASSLQAKGLSDAALMAAVKAENLRVCDPPLPDKEVEQIVASATRYEKGEDRETKTAEAVAKVEEVKASADAVDFTQLELYQKLYNIPNKFEREKQIAEFREIARKQKQTTTFNRMLNAYRTEYVQNKKTQETLKTDFTDSPIAPLSCGEWIADDMGIRRIRMVNGGNETITEVACTHPILPVERYINVDDGLERVVLAFRKDGAWKRTTCLVSKISDRGKIVTELADQGVAVTSGNAALLVQYLYDVLSMNLTQIPQYASIGRFGWMIWEDGGTEFSPYTENLKFDGERSSDKNEFQAVRSVGSFETWKKAVLQARAENPVMKILLAASCAAPVLKLIEKLPFFVHLWGMSGAGKTVALLVALSVWGDPGEGRLLRTFNSTMVGMEREAAFAGNLPIGFNELQVTKGRMDFDSIIYMLCEGIGRVRGNVSGGVDRIAEWRTVFLTNGEQPITSFSSGGGAKSRVFEIECTEDIFSDPQTTANTVRRTYGHVGPLLVDLLKDAKTETLEAMFQGCYNNLKPYAEKKQLDSGAMIMLGDILFRMVTGAEDPLTAEELAPYFTSRDEISIGARAYEYITGWIAQNSSKFEEGSLETYGNITSRCANIIVGVFNEQMEKQGWNPTAVKSELKQMGKLVIEAGRMTRSVRLGTKTARCISVVVDQGEE